MLNAFKKIIVLLLFFFTHKTYTDTPKLTLRSRYGAGFFAELHTVVSYIVLVYFNEEKGREIDVQWTEEFFPYKNDKHENGWNSFFHPIGYVQNTRAINYGELIHDQTCLNKWLSYDDFYPYRLSMHKMLKKYVKIRKEITDSVDQFYNQHMQDQIRIGVHVRYASAHASEKPGAVSLEDYFKEIHQLTKNLNKKYVLYVATDSNYVIEQFKKKYNNLLYIDATRSNYNEEVHLIYDKPEYWLSHPQEFHKKKPGRKGGIDALMDCLLLSKCDYLIHSTSNVSDYATFFNPRIKSIFLPRNINPNKERACSTCKSKDKWYTMNINL